MKIICPKCQKKSNFHKEYYGGCQTGDYVCSNCRFDITKETYNSLKE